MNPVALFCRNCGRGLTEEEKSAAGTVYCSSCAPAFKAAAAPPPLPSSPAGGVPNPSVSPGLAFLLGLLPGVGAIYTGQYAKGLTHAFIFGMFVTAMERMHGGEPLVALVMSGFYFYMPFEAYHTAKKRQMGEPVDELSSLFKIGGSPDAFPWGPVAIIGAGVVFLLNNLDVIHFHQIIKFWPLALIVLGVIQLRQRISGRANSGMEGRP